MVRDQNVPAGERDHRTGIQEQFRYEGICLLSSVYDTGVPVDRRGWGSAGEGEGRNGEMAQEDGTKL